VGVRPFMRYMAMGTSITKLCPKTPTVQNKSTTSLFCVASITSGTLLTRDSGVSVMCTRRRVQRVVERGSTG
jgi:sialic acid synthase SpsE